MILGNLFTQARSILRHQSPEMRMRLWFLSAFTLVVGVLEIGVAGLVSLFGVAVAAPQSVLNLSAARVAVEIFPQLAFLREQPLWLMVVLLGCIVGGVALKNLLLGVLTYKQSHYAAESAAYFASRVFRSYVSQDYAWHLKENAAGLLAIVGYRNQVSTFLTAFLAFITQSLIALGMLVGGFVLAPVPMLIVLGVTGMTAVITYKISRKSIRRNNERIAANLVALNKNIMAGLQGIREVQVYQREGVVVRNVDEKLHAVNTDSAMNTTLPAFPVWTLETMGMVTLLLALLLMIAQGYSLAQVTGTLALLAAMAWRLLPSTNKVVSAVVRMQGNIPYMEKFFEALEALPEENVFEQAPLPLTFSRSITFDAVSFRYPEARTDALQNVSLTIPKGGMVGIVGPSGAGKSTLVSILTGLLMPVSGVISVDGIPLHGRERSRLRSLIGYVPQSPYLLDASLAENVAFSRLGEPIDENAVLEACRLAALDFWEQLSEGIHTRVGDRGVRLSGGQAQRVAIARALHAKPELLVFDEATSALDLKNEQAIHDTINSLRSKMTMVIIAHRLSSVENCDYIIWIHNGCIRAQGEAVEVLPKYAEFLGINGKVALH